MSEVKQIQESDLKIIREMDDKLLQCSITHARLRRQFLAAEQSLLSSISNGEGELRTFIEGVVKGLGVDEKELKDWRMDLATGKLTKVAKEASSAEELLLKRIEKLEGMLKE